MYPCVFEKLKVIEAVVKGGAKFTVHTIQNKIQNFPSMPDF
jgi:hypothetical protein